MRGRGAVLGLQAARAGCRLAGSRALWVVTSTVGVCRRDSTPPSLWTMAPAQPSPSRAAPASPACSWAREGPTGRGGAAATLTPLPSGKPGVTAIKSPQPFLSPGRCGVVGVGEGGGRSSRGVASGHPWVRARAWPWRWSFRPSTLAAGVRPPRPLCLPGATFTLMTRTGVCSGRRLALPVAWDHPSACPGPVQPQRVAARGHSQGLGDLEAGEWHSACRGAEGEAGPPVGLVGSRQVCWPPASHPPDADGVPAARVSSASLIPPGTLLLTTFSLAAAPRPRRQGQSGLDRRLRPCLWVLWIRPLPAPLKLRRKNVNWLWTSGSLQSCRDTIAGWHLGPGWAAAPGPSAHDWGLGVGDQLRRRGARRPVSKAEQGRAGARASVCQLGLAWGVESARPSLQPAG